MENIIELLENLPSHHDTKLETQISFMEGITNIIKTPLTISILNSLKELRGIKNRDMIIRDMEYTNQVIKNKMKI
jgi:hypothetical protein